MVERGEGQLINPVERAIKELDIQTDKGDRISFWFSKDDHSKIWEEVRRRQGEGEYWGGGGIGFYEILGEYRGHQAVVCQKYSYLRFSSLVEELGMDFHIGRVLNRQRLPADHPRRSGRGTLIPELPTALKEAKE